MELGREEQANLRPRNGVTSLGLGSEYSFSPSFLHKDLLGYEIRNPLLMTFRTSAISLPTPVF
jgi:hypothetical protein